MIDRLHKQIVDAGIPIDGVSQGTDSVRINFRSDATEAQRTEAQSIADAFDWTERVPRNRADVLADVQALTAAKFRTLTQHFLADQILANPYWALDLGVDIAGDEPVS